MTRLTDKVAWVTGPGSGIGEAAALVFACEGATVVPTGPAEGRARMRQPRNLAGAILYVATLPARV